MAVSAFIMAYGGIVASRHLFMAMTKSVLRFSMGFFDSTPTGRLLNRFSEDVADIDYVMPFTVRSMINTILQTFLTLGIVIYNLPLSASPVPFLGIFYYFVQV